MRSHWLFPAIILAVFAATAPLSGQSAEQLAISMDAVGGGIHGTVVAAGQKALAPLAGVLVEADNQHLSSHTAPLAVRTTNTSSSARTIW